MSKDLEGAATGATLDKEAPARSAASVTPRDHPTRIARAIEGFIPPRPAAAGAGRTGVKSVEAGAPPHFTDTDFADTEATWWALA